MRVAISSFGLVSIFVDAAGSHLRHGPPRMDEVPAEPARSIEAVGESDDGGDERAIQQRVVHLGRAEPSSSATT